MLLESQPETQLEETHEERVARIVDEIHEKRKAERVEYQRAYGKKWRAENRESILERKRRWRTSNPDASRAESRRTYHRNKHKDARIAYTRAYNYFRLYGITLEQYDEMVAAQDGRCASCNESKKLVVDHSHVTGKVRALLCDSCNKGAGLFRDSPELLRAMASYLERF